MESDELQQAAQPFSAAGGLFDPADEAVRVQIAAAGAALRVRQRGHNAARQRHQEGMLYEQPGLVRLVPGRHAGSLQHVQPQRLLGSGVAAEGGIFVQTADLFMDAGQFLRPRPEMVRQVRRDRGPFERSRRQDVCQQIFQWPRRISPDLRIRKFSLPRCRRGASIASHASAVRL